MKLGLLVDIVELKHILEQVSRDHESETVEVHVDTFRIREESSLIKTRVCYTYCLIEQFS